jgi:hypothetical protein
MICATCKAEGKTSRVFDRRDSSASTYYQSFYDEDGRHHYHDCTVATTGYECSNGHKWIGQSAGSCWCGWPNKEKP